MTEALILDYTPPLCSSKQLEIGVHPDSIVENPLVSAFKHDLSTPRPPEERLGLRAWFTEHVQTEQARLREQSHKGFTIEDIIIGDAPVENKFVALQGPAELLSTELVVDALERRHYNIWILNHPARIEALQQAIEQGYQPPVQKTIPAIDRATKEQKAIDFADLGLVVQEPNPEIDIEESARTLLSQGMYVHVADNLVALPYILSSMPDVSNALSIATHALCAGVAFVPFDSLWNKFENQLMVAKRAREIVLNDPILQNHPNRDFLTEHYQRLIGITVKASPRSIETVKEFIRRGFTTFRFYDARSRNKLEDTIRTVKKALDDPEFDDVKDEITIFAGQISGPNQALRLQEAGANAVICGIGGGGICSTPREAALHTANVNIGREVLKAGLPIPLVFDGGVGPKLPVVLAMGGAATLKSAALVEGTIEQPPGMWYYRLPDGRWGKNYSGEAGPRTKVEGGKVDFLERPLFVEGIDEFVVRNPQAPSMTDNTYALVQSLATAMIFARVESIGDFHEMEKPPIWTATRNAEQRASVHHDNGLLIT